MHIFYHIGAPINSLISLSVCRQAVYSCYQSEVNFLYRALTYYSMPSNGKTDLQRDILITWYENPNSTNKEIAEACDCSASYVSDVKNRFDNYNSMEAMMDREDKEIERMFGENVFSGASSLNSAQNMSEQRGLAEIYEDLPNNAVGNIARGIILVITLYVAYQVGTVLIL